MALTYTQAKTTLDEIAQRSEQNRKRLEQARQLVVAAESDLTAMGTAYSAFITELNTQVSNNPLDPAWKAAGAEKDQMKSDFTALKTRATNTKTAIDSV